ncbi:uncharacterized protein L969DRAFT_95389 [Mixia osmundae IAM 14324]|uniref:Small ribosomal subunit protein uS19m n=1 Tax=Mixia osmundae (strain CBS 9802 / IAM 14324 / JCM 22182 / KY 12970) TaxID=764103 RepID=G7DZ86_MIXOS|nr:uncharacterized protein L969DRAFT_95389 [Mixia osmundae IAM 14324]KEI38298.1 hypothetical protein L969DRAFT_95389 [Mixia osmundae IAM 14324]GAA95896.1 hypothetical protein E5Q_02554 [Mixia osmundae IAM 14324]
MQSSGVRLARSAWKGPYFTSFPIQRKPAGPGQAPQVILTDHRACTILPSFVGMRFAVHNGKSYLPITITSAMVGHKLGEFSVTRKRFSYKQSKNR